MRFENVLQTKRPLSAKIASGLEKLPQKNGKNDFFALLGSFWIILQFKKQTKNHFKRSRIVPFLIPIACVVLFNFWR